MIKHIGLPIGDITEIHNFYETILGFEKINQFTMPTSLAGKIFGFEESPEVFMMHKDGMELELFLSNQTVKPAWTHTCLTLPDAENIFHSAGKAGYQTILHEGRNGFTYFVRDKQRNLFEIKSSHS